MTKHHTMLRGPATSDSKAGMPGGPVTIGGLAGSASGSSGVLIAIASLLALGQIQRADQEVLLIPQGITGDIFIVFRVQSGQPPAREGGARLYRIPSTGILATQEPPNSGMSPLWKFYYESPRAERQALGRIWASGGCAVRLVTDDSP